MTKGAASLSSPQWCWMKNTQALPGALPIHLSTILRKGRFGPGELGREEHVELMPACPALPVNLKQDLHRRKKLNREEGATSPLLSYSGCVCVHTTMGFKKMGQDSTVGLPQTAAKLQLGLMIIQSHVLEVTAFTSLCSQLGLEPRGTNIKLWVANTETVPGDHTHIYTWKFLEALLKCFQNCCK